MHLETIKIRNFRLLRRLSIDLAKGKTTTILVGPNNSGKTSVMDALRLFVGVGADNPKISFHDLSQLRHRDLKRVEALLGASTDSEKKIEILKRFAPRMRVDLTFAYDEDPADLIAATQLLMDLTPALTRSGSELNTRWRTPRGCSTISRPGRVRNKVFANSFGTAFVTTSGGSFLSSPRTVRKAKPWRKVGFSKRFCASTSCPRSATLMMTKVADRQGYPSYFTITMNAFTGWMMPQGIRRSRMP